MKDNISGVNSQLVRPEDIADFAGVSVRRIQQLTQEGIIKSVSPPKGGAGRRYDFLPTVRALLMHYREQAGKKSAPSEAMAEEKLKRETARRKLDEIKLMKEKGELHYTEDIEAVFTPIFTRLRTGLLSLPQGLAPLLLEQTDINTVAEIIRDRLSRTMTELSTFSFKQAKKRINRHIEDSQEDSNDE